MKKLLIAFDIDGTLLHADGAGRSSLQLALLHHFGTELSIENIAFAGRTDKAIIRDILVQAGLSKTEIRHHLPLVAQLYVDSISEGIEAFSVRSLPGVLPLLETLQQTDEVLVSLLTGNLEPSAFVKLQAANLHPFFSVGAFGSDSEDRNKLPAILLRRVEKQTGIAFHAKQLIVVGDTPHDVGCAHFASARSIAVATGFSSHEELVKSEPDLLLEDLNQTEKLNSYLSDLGVTLDW